MIFNWNHMKTSRSISKINALLAAPTSQKIEALCVWIEENSDKSITWERLSTQSGLTHTELISLFQIHKHQTPMAYIKNVREQKKKDLPRYPQADLFKSLRKTDNKPDWVKLLL